MKSLAVCLFLSVFAAAVDIPEEDGVLVLGDDNFADAVNSHEFMLVEFYAPWCGHCKKLAPEWASAAQTLKGSNIYLAKVDATEHKNLAEQFSIKGFPTIKMFKSGKAFDYQGGRTAADIVAYARKQSGPPAITVSSVEELEGLQEGNDVFVLGFFGDVNSAAAKAFTSVASLDDSLTYAISSNDAVKAQLGVSGDAVVVLKAFDEGRADFPVEGTLDKDAVASFITQNSLPLINEFSPESAKKIFGSPVKKHALFFTVKSDAHHTPTVAVFREIASNYRGQVLAVNVPSTETKVLEYFGIKASQLPALVLADMSGEGQMKKYSYSGKFEAAELSAFLNSFLKGELKQVLKSEAVDASDLAGAVKVVKGNSFNDIVINNNKDVLIEFYAPWCGHCQKLAPTWNQLGEELKDVSSVVIAKSDATANEFDYPGLSIRGFPTIYFFKGDDKVARRYEGGREVDDFIQFLKENGANKINSEEL